MAAQNNNQTPDKDIMVIRVGFFFESEAYRYTLVELIGDGGYGRVFEAEATSKKKNDAVQKVAVKIEATSYNIEARVLQIARDTKCQRIPLIFDQGFITDRKQTFVSMQLKGRDLYQLRKERIGGKFSLSTAIRTGIETLEAIRELHEQCGYISRDIKPGNFVTGPTTSDDIRNVYLIDFGLCRKYRDANNNILPSRGEIGWRGTNRYGSLQAHRRMDLGRRDDLESWLYMLMELTNGSLPWTTERDRGAIYEKKLEARKNVAAFIIGCPEEYTELLTRIDNLQFADAPCYKELDKHLEEILKKNRIDRNGPMDWEVATEQFMQDAATTDSISNQTPTTQQFQRV